MGEGLPFYYWRFGEDLDRIAKNRLHKPVQRYFHDNLWITTSAFFRDELLRLALATVGEDRIMFSVDYPMASARREGPRTGDPYGRPVRQVQACLSRTVYSVRDQRK